MASFLSRPVDFVRHNEEVRALWDAFDRREAPRAPCVVGGSISNYFLNPDLNTRGWEFRDYFEDVHVQIRAQLEFQEWLSHHVLCDREMGVPADGWQLATDFQNSWEASWFGCELVYHPGLIPDTLPVLADDPDRVYELPDPDPLRDGLVGRAVEFFDAMVEICPTLEHRGAPVRPPAAITGEGTDGPFDCAVKMRGPDVMLDMLAEPERFHALMDYITRNIIRRIRALKEHRWRRLPGSPDAGVFRRKNFWLADDAIAMLSVEHYTEHVLPYHRRIVEEFCEPGTLFVHLCGDATRHFPTIVRELGACGFDTGFPVDHGALRRTLGPDVVIAGGPTVMLIKDGPAEAIETEVRRICESGALEGGRFYFIAANNMAPRTPVEHVAAFYDAVRRHAIFPARREVEAR